MTKRKEERRELLKHDEFLTQMEQVARFIQTNPRKVSIWIGVFVILLAGIAGGINLYKNTKDQAAAQLYEAKKIYVRGMDDPTLDTKFETQKEKNEAALKSFNDVLKKTSGQNRLQTLVYKASCEMDLGLMDDAMKTYEELSKDSSEYGVMGLLGLADLYLGKEDYQKAIDTYNKVNQTTVFPMFEDLVKFKLAKAYQLSGDLKSAELELEGLVQKYEALDPSEIPPIQQEAKSLLDEIKGDSSAS